MGFLDFFRSKPVEKRYPVEESTGLLIDFLRRGGFRMDAPDPRLAWSLFKDFCMEYRFHCDDDALLWEIGPYGRSPQGERVFQWHLVRQFITDPGEDDDMKQLCFDLEFAPCGTEIHPAANLWTYDFDGDFEAFFAAVEARPDFPLPDEARAVSAQVMLDDV